MDEGATVLRVRRSEIGYRGGETLSDHPLRPPLPSSPSFALLRPPSPSLTLLALLGLPALPHDPSTHPTPTPTPTPPPPLSSLGKTMLLKMAIREAEAWLDRLASPGLYRMVDGPGTDWVGSLHRGASHHSQAI